MSILSLIPGIPSPATLLAGVVVAGIIATGSFYEGHHIATQAEQAAMLKATQAAQAKYDAEVLAYNAVAQQLEVTKNEHAVLTKTITKSVNKYINRPIYKSECFDSDGLRDANRALSGSTRPSKPASVVPPAKPTK